MARRVSPDLPAPVIIDFAYKKPTAGTFRYEEIDEKGKAVPQSASRIGTLYLRKSFVGIDPPARYRVLLTPM